MTVRNLIDDFELLESRQPTIVWNDNQGCVDWTKGVSISKKLRHLNMREISVRLWQQLRLVDVRHIADKTNIADIFTKEIKDTQHLRNMAFNITTPRLIANWNPITGETISSGMRGALKGAENIRDLIGSVGSGSRSATNIVVQHLAVSSTVAAAARAIARTLLRTA
jgi:hypothetical protein